MALKYYGTEKSIDEIKEFAVSKELGDQEMGVQFNSIKQLGEKLGLKIRELGDGRYNSKQIENMLGTLDRGNIIFFVNTVEGHAYLINKVRIWNKNGKKIYWFYGVDPREGKQGALPILIYPDNSAQRSYRLEILKKIIYEQNFFSGRINSLVVNYQRL